MGINADFSASNLTNGTAIGSGAIVNASNKVRIGNTAVTVIEGQVAYSFTSDRNQKEYFRPVNGEEVLRKLRGFNLTSWNYIGQDPQAFRHYGPMAQDFYAAFGKDEIGTIGTPTTINSGDLSGVMLSAIQELSIENEAMKAEAGNRRAEISSQQKQLEALQQQLSAQRQQIAALKALVCQTHPQAAVCKEQ
ncbi:MAG: tail fiber domain-containing protein [Acidobacteria bacterium]|nr:tail fiber domain-containing protein [Acidobacteriota bacterium]